ncbi:MAG: filamentous hemagglutinin N-terminal domain-containing protein, partial [Cyanobacteria bacterium SID2]|nr:filamentous hemagglutinin N-terminal domain-containing protein [Cyanobacteria bacterium SID2]
MTSIDPLVDRIDGGAIRGENLFHSFQEFNIEEGHTVNFSDPGSIENILTRVTGNNPSNILGTLGTLGNANFFLINPNGIVFGPNAQLNVGGSFLASTANSLVFANGYQFSATNPATPPLLTIDIPLGVQFGTNPGSIVNQSKITENSIGLQGKMGETLGFLGGQIVLEGGEVAVEGGRVEIGSVASFSTVNLTPTDTGYVLNYEDVRDFQDIQLSEASIIDVSGEGSGDLQLQGNRIILTEASGIIANTTGAQPGGTLFVRGVESVELNDSVIFSNVELDAIERGADIEIETGRLSIDDGWVVAQTVGSGDAGNLTVRATESIEVIGVVPRIQRPSELTAVARSNAMGNSGNVLLETPYLLILDGAQVSSASFGEGNAGNLTVRSSNVELIGTTEDGEISSSLTASSRSGIGGRLTIDTERLLIRDGAQVFTGTSGAGNGGSLTVNASDIQIISGAVNGDRAPSGLRTDTSGLENAGDLIINTQTLLLSNGAQSGTGTFGDGNGGNLTVTASESVEVVGYGEGAGSSILSTQSDGNATGNAGNLTINTPQLRVTDGGRIFAGTFGSGNGGRLTVNASESIHITGIAEAGNAVSLLSSGTRGSGKAGDVEIITPQLSVIDGGRITADTINSGNGGQLNIYASEFVHAIGSSADNQFASLLSTQTNATGNAGNLTIETQQLLVRDGAQIGAGTFGEGNGGNLSIAATDWVRGIGTSTNGQSVSLIFTTSEGTREAGNLTINTSQFLLQDGAQVSAATSNAGAGGRLTVNAIESVQLLGISSNDQFPSALLTASNGTGNAGNVTVTTPELIIGNNAQISASVSGTGRGGDISINAAASVEIFGPANSDRLNGIFAVSEGNGDAGNVHIETDRLTLRDRSGLSVSGVFSGSAGDLTVRANSIDLDNQSSFQAETAAGTQGNIDLTSNDLVLRRNSNITTNATGTATGGNITIDTGVLAALENSDISANAEASFGGRVTINTQG